MVGQPAKRIQPIRSEVIWMEWWLRAVVGVVVVGSEIDRPTNVKLSGVVGGLLRREWKVDVGF
jgi:hypothetical protein